MIRIRIIFTFMLGFSIGALLAVIIFFTKNYNNGINNTNNFDNDYNVLNHKDLNNNKIKKHNDNNIFKPNYNSHIICVIISTELSTSFAASKSWAKHCDIHHFIGMVDKKNYNNNNNHDYFKYLNVTTFEPKHSWHFLCNAILYLYNVYKKLMQWVIIVQDDVFVIPENLKYYVIYKDFNKPYYLGDLSFFWSVYYNTARAGFVLSKGAIKLIVKHFNTTYKCSISGKHWKAEDYYLGKHLTKLGVTPEDTRDSRGRGRFHTFTPEQLYSPDNPNILSKYFRRRVHPNVQGPNCCSDKTITFQGTTQHRIYFYYYLLYRIRPYMFIGENPNNLSSVYKPSPEVWQKFIRDEFGENVDLDTITDEKYYNIWTDKISPNQLLEILKKFQSSGSQLQNSIASFFTSSKNVNNNNNENNKKMIDEPG